MIEFETTWKVRIFDLPFSRIDRVEEEEKMWKKEREREKDCVSFTRVSISRTYPPEHRISIEDSNRIHVYTIRKRLFLNAWPFSYSVLWHYRCLTLSASTLRYPMLSTFFDRVFRVKKVFETKKEQPIRRFYRVKG